ncbi:MAG TPA: class A beta-lactamase-related serine hydrolase [Candidatus Doudnabacteria bacterium]|nr:class A beta-lactamase-related serine hydrolase [Candidatus Doudnabacteria bacterium]
MSKKHFTNEKDNRPNLYKIAFFVVLILLVTIMALGYNGILPREARKNALMQKNDYSFLNPSVRMVEKENLLVNFEPLRSSLKAKYEIRDDYMISLYFEYLPTGANITLNRDERIWPASLIKIPVAMAAMKKVETGLWKFSNELVILDEDKDSEYGDLYKQPTGTTLTIEQLLKETLINSDNTAHFVLLRNLDGSDLEDVYTHLGLEEVISALKLTPKDGEVDNRMTAKNYSVFFRSLFNATYFSPQYSQQFMDILQYAPKEYLGQGVPSEVPFVHKTGIRVEDRVKADSGIVYVKNRPYLITVMIQKKAIEPIPEGEVEEIFRDISKEIYDYVSKAN